MEFKDGFFINDEEHQIKVISKIREFKPDIVLCNAITDRHIDHPKGNNLVNDSCFLSGLEKIKTHDCEGQLQEPWRPRIVLEYIQWEEIKPDLIFDISGFLETKVNAVRAYSSQFYNPKSKEVETPISSSNFINSVAYRALNMGRLISTDAGEGFTSRQTLSINNLNDLIRK
jgi:bacillithiol biosynthesis deacetylase BshB1